MFGLDNRVLAFAGVLFVAMLVLPFIASIFWIIFFFFLFIWIAFSETWALLEGWAGLVNLGHNAFIGVGAYAMAVATTLWGLPLWVSLLFAGIGSAVFAFVVSFALFRMRGLYFGMASLVVASAVTYWFSIWDYTKGGQGIFISADLSYRSIYFLAFALAVVSIIVLWRIDNSKLGLRLKAIAEDQDAAEICGVNVRLNKLYVYLVALFITGVAGAVYFLYPLYLTPSSAFAPSFFLSIIAAVMIGGRGTIAGPVIGSGIIICLRQFLFVDYPGWSMLMYGVIIVVVLLITPYGIMGLVPKIKSRLESLKKS